MSVNSKTDRTCTVVTVNFAQAIARFLQSIVDNKFEVKIVSKVCVRYTVATIASV